MGILEKVLIVRNVAKKNMAEPFAVAAPSRHAATGWGAGFETMAAPAALSAPPELRLDTAALTPKEILDSSQGPDVVGIAPPMATMLVRPVTESAPGPVWGLDAVGATHSAYTGKGAVVAVLDTGIDKGHPAFSGATIEEKDFSGCGNGDVQGHGTHCAGTIFGGSVGGVRIGIAPGVKKALIGKVFDDSGPGSTEMIVEGVLWALQQGANIISMSLGLDFSGQVAHYVAAGMPVEAATSKTLEAYRANVQLFDNLFALTVDNAVWDQGTLCIAAAGNSSDRPRYVIGAGLPAAAKNIISVGAVEQAGGGKYAVTYFSNTYPQIVAPGAQVTSAVPGGGLGAKSGTSMACPHVAGVAALWWETLAQGMPSALRARTVQAKLLGTARGNVFAPGGDPADLGTGLVTAP